MVYAFIATPVQLWHHHNIVKEKKEVADTKGTLSQGTGSAPESNCPVCSHKYSIYNDHALLLGISSIAGFLPRYKPYIREAGSLSIPAFSNKGPPLHCC